MIFRLGVIDDDSLCRDDVKYPDFCRYASTTQYIILADSEEQARLTASLDRGDNSCDEHRGWWLDPEVTSCREITDSGQTEIIGRSEPTG